MKVFALVGARPNFIKVAALDCAFQSYPDVDFRIVHTGQHSRPDMYDRFFEQLLMPKPYRELHVQDKLPHRLIADITHRFGDLLRAERPDAAILVGDVNSTLGGALAALKTGIPIAHVEAGLRCGDATMPEEANRILTDRMSRWLFTTETAAGEHLRREGAAEERIHFVGNVMIDSLMRFLPDCKKSLQFELLGLEPGQYVLSTIHRNFNIQNPEALEKIVAVLEGISQQLPVVFPVHPTTEHWLRKFDLWKKLGRSPAVHLMPPEAYLEFLYLMKNAALVVTDSGGVQEETTFLNIPCLTYRPSTERPVTTESGTNRLVYNESAEIIATMAHSMINRGNTSEHHIPPLWDGHAADRIANILTHELYTT